MTITQEQADEFAKKLQPKSDALVDYAKDNGILPSELFLICANVTKYFLTQFSEDELLETTGEVLDKCCRVLIEQLIEENCETKEEA